MKVQIFCNSQQPYIISDERCLSRAATGGESQIHRADLLVSPSLMNFSEIPFRNADFDGGKIGF
jgi:hypothetical protein